MPFKTNFPRSDYPFVSLRDGTMTDAWYRYMLTMFNRCGGEEGTSFGGKPGSSLNLPSTSGNVGQYLTSGGSNATAFWTTPPPLITDLAQLTNSPGYVTNAALTPYAKLNGAAFTGSPTSNTSPQDTNSNVVATDAFVLNQASTVLPLADGTAAIGTSLRYARADHVHPPPTNETFAGTVKAAQFTAGTATWTSGSAPPTSVQPNGSIYSNTSGATGTRLYVSNGATWLPVTGV